MDRRRGSGAGSWAAGLLALLAACQPLPHPFAYDRPPRSLTEIRGGAGVAVAPLGGHPTATARKLGAAVTDALLKREILASERTTNLDSYRLYGEVQEGAAKGTDATVSVVWRLQNAKGRQIAERRVQTDAPIDDWLSGKPPPIERLAALSAEALAPLIEDKTPAAAPVPASETNHVRVAVDKISGAPGDGATSLAAAVAAVLTHQNVEIVKKDEHADVLVSGEIAVSPPQEGKQHVKVLWRVRRADGTEIGMVGQENDIPKGMLDGPWGDVAYSVAIAAGDGLMQLVARGAPAPKS